MIKGAQRKMIVMKTSDSAFFEEAYFVLRKENRDFDDDMVKEANKIIDEGGIRRKPKKRKLFGEWIFAAVGFLCGALLGGGVVALIIAI